MLHQFSRTELLIGTGGLEKLQKSKVIIFGVGGVGSFTAEALARSGIGHLTLVDYDSVCLTNVNRQIHAFPSNVGKLKVEVMKERLQAINPRLEVKPLPIFYGSETESEIWSESYDYIVDAIDTISAKITLAEKSIAIGVPIIASMGAGNKLDPTRFKVVDISKTHTDPIAKVMRKELKKRGITGGVRVVFSDEPPLETFQLESDCRTHCICPGGHANCTNRRNIPGSVAFVPSVAGLIMAGVVVRDLCGLHKKE